MNTGWQQMWFLLAQQQPGPAGGAPAQQAPGGASAIFALLPWIMIGVLFYVMMIRPERRKRAELDVMLKNLKKNDRVVTIGGIFGTVVQASDDADEVTLRIDENNNTRIRVLRSSISRVIAAESAGEPQKAS
jgi:preprotein translocase subunit YajC